MIPRRRMLAATVALAGAAAAPGWAQVLALANGEVLRGRFTQKRFLQGFGQPLTSTGSFILAPGRGVAWRGETPFAMVTVMGPNGLVQRVSGGATTHYSVARMPAIVRLYEVFGSALSGDWQKLTAVFEVRRDGSDAAWTVILTPLRAGAGDLPIGTVTVRGGRYVDAVEVKRTNGDWDRVEFSQQAPSRQPIDAEAAELFDMVNRP